MDKKKILVSVVVVVLMILALLAAFSTPAHAAGGGIVEQLVTNNNAGSASCATTMNGQGGVVSGDYLIISVWVTKGQTVSSVSDGTGGSSFAKQVSSTVNVDVEQWAEQYTGTTGSVTVTATLSASTANKCILYEVDGLKSATVDASSTGSGTLSSTSPWTSSVGSFSPTANDFCVAATAATETGTVTAINQSPSNPFQNAGTSGTSGNGKQIWGFAAWNIDSSFIPTTASNSITTTGLTGGGWDEIVGCYLPVPTITTTTSPTTTTTTTVSTTSVTASSTTTTTTAVSCTNCGQEPNYDWLLVFPFILIIVVLLLRRR